MAGVKIGKLIPLMNTIYQHGKRLEHYFVVTSIFSNFVEIKEREPLYCSANALKLFSFMLYEYKISSSINAMRMVTSFSDSIPDLPCGPH